MNTTATVVKPITSGGSHPTQASGGPNSARRSARVLRSIRSKLLHAIAGDLPEFAADRLAFLPAVARERGPVALMRFGVLRVALLSDPNLIDEVLVRRNKEFGNIICPMSAVPFWAMASSPARANSGSGSDDLPSRHSTRAGWRPTGT